MSKAGYGYKWCHVCGKSISSSGGGVHHFRKHVREGKMYERKWQGYTEHWYTTFEVTEGTPKIYYDNRKEQDG